MDDDPMWDALVAVVARNLREIDRLRALGEQIEGGLVGPGTTFADLRRRMDQLTAEMNEANRNVYAAARTAHGLWPDVASIGTQLRAEAARVVRKERAL